MIEIPTPTTLLQITWTIIGFMFGRSIGKKLDQDTQQTEWFKNLSPFWQNRLKSLMDFFHHFFVGLLMMLYFPHVPELYWFGYGLVIDDAPDIPPRFRKYFDYLGWFKEEPT